MEAFSILGREVSIKDHIISISCEKEDDPRLICVNIIKYLFEEGILSAPVSKYKVRAVEYI